MAPRPLSFIFWLLVTAGCGCVGRPTESDQQPAHKNGLAPLTGPHEVQHQGGETNKLHVEIAPLQQQQQQQQQQVPHVRHIDDTEVDARKDPAIVERGKDPALSHRIAADGTEIVHSVHHNSQVAAQPQQKLTTETPKTSVGDRDAAFHRQDLPPHERGKELTHPQRDLSAQLQVPPWERLDDNYLYDSEEYYDYYETEDELLGPSIAPQTAPDYMVELYERFNSDRYSHPMANIVRSFQNINEEKLEPVPTYGNISRVHILQFNISSISRDEDLYLGEMRLYTLVEQDRNDYHGVDRRVSLYQETGSDLSQRELLDTKVIYGSHTGWETFTVTNAVKRWVKARTSVQLVEVRIESVYEGATSHNDGQMDIDTRSHHSTEPLLVVFSNDKKKGTSRELHELLAQEMKYLDGDTSVDNSVDYGDRMMDFSSVYHMGNLRVKRRATADNDTENAAAGDGDDGQKVVRQKHHKQQQQQQQQQQQESAHPQRPDSDVEGDGDDSTRSKRATVRKQRKGRKRNICRRKRMYVDFRDINWHRWIIAPKGYEAYACTGRCYFPLSDHLTPTKHAIIQTLLHTNFPQKGSRACCVPTRLDPISILYVDEQGVVTYKYRYEGMVVAQCGCR